MNKLLLTSALALGLASGAFADTLSLTALNGGAASGSTLVNFDELTLGSSTQWTAGGSVQVSFTGAGQVVTGSSNGLYAAPYISGVNGVGFGSPDQPNGQDATHYLTSGIGSFSLTFGSAQKYLGLLWGSVDNYNTLEFWSGANLVGSFGGSAVTASANGNQGAAGTFYVYVNDLDGTFDKVVGKSTNYAFEVDNISFDSRAHVPDSGSTIALIGAALLGLAALRRRS